MHPNIVIGNAIISSWYTMLFAGVIVSTLAAILLKPRGFPLSRIDLFTLGIILIISGLFGARLLFILLHAKTIGFKISDLVSREGGFAYFGSLALAIPVIWLYARARRIGMLSLLDYCMPFLMLSQFFVRIGCLMAGCCYGRPAGRFFGVVFKTVDKLPRYPAQGYEALLLLGIYFIGRSIYKRRADIGGYTFFAILFLYTAGRFFIEFFRVDSPTMFLNLTLAQVTCLVLTALSVFACVRAGSSH